MARSGDVLRATSVVVLLAGAALLGACTDDTDAEPVGTSTVARSTPPTTPAPTTTAPPTTDAPTTTIDAAAQLAAEVEADLREAYQFGNESLLNPFDAEAEQRALDRRLGIVRSDFAQTIAEFRAGNYALRPNPDMPAGIAIEIPARPVASGSDVVELQICEIDSWVKVEVGSGPDGSDSVVDDSILAYRSTVFMRKVDSIWKMEGGNEIGRWEGVIACPAG